MKFTLSWLKDHLQTEATLEEISTTLTRIGLEVESIVDPADKLSAFKIAHVIEAKPHPNADKLKVCKVDAGQGVVQVVCGASNAKSGLIAVFAAPGTFVPGLGITLGKANIRGVDSLGMLCSEKELELSDEGKGIIELPSKMKKYIGERFVTVMGLDDPVIDISVTPNRPDCLGVRGVARDLAAAGLGKLKKIDDSYVDDTAFKSPISIKLDFPKEAQNACPFFAGRLIRGIKNKAAPEWMQRRLRAIGLRPINAAVDITNYITYDRARPLHVYDADRLKGAVHARLGRKGESFTGLDGKSHAVDETMCVIADDAQVLGLGGIMGGAETGVQNDTTSVFLESAYFDPIRTAAAGRKTGINSDARYRFERGIDPQSILSGLNLATKVILQICGGEASKAVIAGSAPEAKTRITFDPARVQKLSGAKYSNTEVVASLKKLGFEVKGQAPTLQVQPPSWRPDIHGAADLVEEVVRLAGAERIPSTPLPRTPGVRKVLHTESQKRVATTKRILATRGLVETVTWSFISQAEAKLFGGGESALRLSNPISTEMSDMRPSLLPGLVRALALNANRGFSDAALFEVGQIFSGTRPEDQAMAASGARSGTASIQGAGRHWSRGEKTVDLYDPKADALSVLSAFGLDEAKMQVTRKAPAWFHPGRSGAFQLGPKAVLGYFGELHPEVLRAFDLNGRVGVFELFLDALPGAKKKSTSKGPLIVSDFQPVRRDFAFLVNREIDAAVVLKAVEVADKTMITRVVLFDIFEGQGVPDGKKSLGIEVTITPRERTLTEDDIEGISSKVISQVRKAAGAELRG